MTDQEWLELAALATEWKHAALKVLDAARLPGNFDLYQAMKERFLRELHNPQSASPSLQDAILENPAKHSH